MVEKLRVGWIGTGVMGGYMAGHLLAAGFPLTVHTRTKNKAEHLLNGGARWAESPRELASSSDVVFSIVGYPKDVEEVMLGERGVLEGLCKNGVLCDMTTSSPALAERIAAVAVGKGCIALDAPVTGGDVGARNAKLSIFVGGDKAGFEKIKPCLEVMGPNILHCGPAGFGQRAKLANQIAVAGVMFSVCESLFFAQEAGLDVAKWLELVVPGAAGSTAMDNLGRRALAGDYKPGFFIDHFVKDLGLCLEECRRMRIVLPGLTAAEQMYRAMQAQGGGAGGTQSLVLGLASFSGKQWRTLS
ncbi:MAG: NAD(P)-dependent oxidoreductase [Desulfovibrio sp.]|jgi:3-hydroxyisobutyrate dehydrogenase|nr:NAD(P)-dependent oxidoreductase [Desulfovibrio sp.]